MSRKVACALVGLACALALSAGSARANGDGGSVIVFQVQNLGPAEGCSNALFGLAFDMVSPGGELLGTGTSCVFSFEGCSLSSGCRATVRATFTLEFARGSLTAAMTLREVWPTDFSFVQRAKGRITAGTGGFEDAHGWVKTAGTATFTDQGADLDLVGVVHLTNDGDGD